MRLGAEGGGGGTRRRTERKGTAKISTSSLTNFKCHDKTYLFNKLLICSRVFIYLLFICYILFHFLSL